MAGAGFVLREEYCWLVVGGWFVVREKHCWLVADKPSEQGAGSRSHHPRFFFKSPRHAPAPVSPLEIESAVDREN
jgi:hypothetical protein